MNQVILDPEDEHLRCLFYVGNGYAVREVDNATTYMHKVIMKASREFQVDHINGNKLDNRKTNLRLCSAAQNSMNKSIASNNTSGYKGVTWRKSRSKWLASIRINTTLIHLGSFDYKEQAALAYDAAARKYFKQFAKLNFDLELT